MSDGRRVPGLSMVIAVFPIFLLGPIIYAQAQELEKYPKLFPIMARRPRIEMWPAVMNHHVVEKIKKELELYPLEGMKLKCQHSSVQEFTIDKIKKMVGDYIRNPKAINYHRHFEWHLAIVNRTGKPMWTEVLPGLVLWLETNVRLCGFETYYPVHKKVTDKWTKNYKQQWIEVVLGVSALILKTFVVIQHKNKASGFVEKPFWDKTPEKYITLLENWVDRNGFQKSLNTLKQLIRDSFDIVTAIMMDHLVVLKGSITVHYVGAPGLLELSYGVNQGRLRVENQGRFQTKKPSLVQKMVEEFFTCEVVNNCKCTKRPVMRMVTFKDNYNREYKHQIVISDITNCVFKCSVTSHEWLYRYAEMTTQSAVHMWCMSGFSKRDSTITYNNRTNKYDVHLPCSPLRLMKAVDEHMLKTCAYVNGQVPHSCLVNNPRHEITIYPEKEMKSLIQKGEFQSLKVEQVMVV